MTSNLYSDGADVSRKYVLENFEDLTSHWTTVSIVKQLSQWRTRFFVRHCPMSGANIQVIIIIIIIIIIITISLFSVNKSTIKGLHYFSNSIT